jgi:cobalt-zinc-cadmium efflux system outer membrane protein
MPARAKPGPSALALAVIACNGACVSSEAGYEDVRSLTAARLQADVRWYEHDSPAAGSEQVRKLLAQPLTADTAVQVALLNNPGLQATFEELGVARARMLQALRLPNPTLDAALRYGASESDNPSIDLDALLDVTELLFIPWRSGKAGAQMDAARLSVAGAVIDLAFETRASFYTYQAAAQTLELRRSVVLALSASFELAGKLHEAGNITDLSFATERALYEESRVAYTGAEAAVQAAREELSALLGVWGQGAAWTAEERLPEPAPVGAQLAELEARAIDKSLDLELSRQRFAAAAKGANLATVRGWVPELRAGVSAEREADQGAEWAVGPAVALELPLFYQGQGETGVELADMRREQRQYADLAIRIRATARASAARLEAAAKSAAYYRDVLLPLRQHILDETQLQFNAMSVSAFQLLQAKRDQIETARAYVASLHDYWAARAMVDQLLAGRLPRRAAQVGAASSEYGSSSSNTSRAH